MASEGKGRFVPFILVAVVVLALLPVAIVLGFYATTGNDSEKPSENPTVQPSQPSGSESTTIQTTDPPDFEPTDATVSVGRTVAFQNVSQTTHEILIEPGDVTIRLDAGQTGEWTPDEAGKYDITCQIHPNQMTGTITVAEE